MSSVHWLWKAVPVCGITYQGSSEEPDQPCRAVGSLMNDIEITAVFVETSRVRGGDLLMKVLKLQQGLSSL
jgi:hypothetical protein